MKQRYKNWYNSLHKPQQLAVAFAGHWMYWFVLWLVTQRYVFEEEHTLGYHFFHATLMALVMTTFFNWNTVKLLFRSRKQQKNK